MSIIQEAVPWPSRPASAPESAARRLARLAAILGLSLLVLLVLAAWAIPPMLDWGRFRTAIENIVGAELGRKVQIGGEVALRMLPEAVLTATDVTLPDRGDGVSARVANLRLEVGIFPLLTGRLVLRELVLGAPVLSLPWPLPAGLLKPERPHVPHPFAAHMENGTLHVGQTAITGITAAIHGWPETLQAPDTGATAFAAEGFAAFDGQNWRFTTALGAPDADGVSAVDLAVQGQGPARDTGGAVQGTLADGVLQGRLRADGPDLSQIMPASRQAWHAEAPFIANGERIVSSALTLALGGAPANANFVLQLAPPVRLDARLTAASLDLDAWVKPFAGRFAGFDPPAIPIRLDVAADSANLLGGTLGALGGALLFDGTHAALENVHATLPGRATLGFSGQIARGENAALSVEGPATLDAPDLHTTLAWLRPLAPNLVDAMPQAVLRSARLSGTAGLAQGILSAKKMLGTLDGVPMSGRFNLDFGVSGRLAATITLDRLAVDDWLGDSAWHPGMMLADFARPFSRVATDLHLHAAAATWQGNALTDLVLDAATGPEGLSIGHAGARLQNARLDFAGSVGPDGRLASVRGHAATEDAAKLLPLMPPAWRLTQNLWQGPADIALAADGPPEALALRLRADTGDLVLQAEGTRDTLSGVADTTLAVRHPGAPRLLAAIGIPSAEQFLDTGSLGLLAHLHTSPGHLMVTDFSLEAGALNLSGHGQADFSGPDPEIDADIAADQLAVPGLAALHALHLPDGMHLPSWHGRIGFLAKNILVDLAPEMDHFSAELLAQDGDFLLRDVQAGFSGGHASLAMAVDITQAAPHMALQGALTGVAIDAPLAGLPVDIASGGADLSVDFFGEGRTAAALLGTIGGQASLVLHDASVTGFDLARLTALATAKPRPTQDAIRAALSQGVSPGFSGEVAATLDHGRAVLAGGTFSSADGAVSADGTLDLATRSMDVTLGLTPALADPPHFAIHLQGAGRDVKVNVDPGKVVSPPHKTHYRQRRK